ncbi:AMP-binding protein [Streptomyces sp. NPDC051677]|uniref:AMP-binding protein n=1 Tax=Streptomyces sp. NPDC051677 TaxID=3365669 RepID=UPI0037D12834
MNQTVIGDLPRINAGRLPGGLAVVDGERRVSWSELDERVNRLCHVLVDRLQLSVQDRVALLAANCLESVELSFATSRARLVYTGLNVRHHVDDMTRQMLDSGAQVLFATPAFAAQARELARRTGAELAWIGAPDGDRSGDDVGEPPADASVVTYEQMLAEASAEPVPAHGDADLPYTLVYTSGTTGAPRGALVASRDQLAGAVTLLVTTETQVDDVFMLVLPRFHKAGEFSLAHAAYAARPLVLAEPSPEAICRAIETERVTCFVLVPTIMRMLVSHMSAPDAPHYDLSSLRHICYGSSPIPVEHLKEFAQLFRCDLSQIGGSTEGGACLSLTRRDHQRGFTDPAAEHILSSCGRVQPGVEMRIVDENDTDVAEGEVGELVYRGDMLISGYHNQPEATERLWQGGWLHSGDLGYRDPDGYVYYVERLGGRIKSGGETVLAREVEEALLTHAAVAVASVVGVPDPVWGEAVCAVVQLHARPAEPEDVEQVLRDHVRSRLGSYKSPKHVVVLPSLPTTALGKIARGEVKQAAISVLNEKEEASL